MFKKERIKDIIIKNKWDILIILIYAIITFIITIIFHEKWRDEAQAWLISRDLNIFQIIKQMSYEGHPPVWHIILFPFAKLGFPYITESLISWIIMVITACIVFFKLPFKKEIKILVLLTFPFLYLYPTISRSYCLIPLAMSLIGVYYPQRKQKLIKYTLSILLLAYTHVIMLGLVGMLFLFFFLEEMFYIKKTKLEKKKLIISIIIAVLGLLCLFFILLGSTSKNSEIPLNNQSIYFSVIRIKLTITSICRDIMGPITYYIGFKFYFILWVVLAMIWQLKKDNKGLLIMIISIIWQIVIYLFIFGSSEQKSNTIFLIVLLIAWMNYYSEDYKIESKFIKKIYNIVKYGFIIIMILNSMNGISYISSEIGKNYSNAKETAVYIEENIQDNSIFVCLHGPTASAIIPYTNNKKFWNPSSKKYFTYVTWDKVSNTYLTPKQAVNTIKDNFKKGENVYIIESNTLYKDEFNELEKNNNLSKIFEINNNSMMADEEYYYIYKINTVENKNE